MKTYIRTLLILSLVLVAGAFGGCTKYNLVELNGPEVAHNTTMWQYFESDPYNWSLTMQMIDRAGLRSVFEGKSEFGTKITFFGITNASIERYILQQQIDNQIPDFSLESITPEECRDIILSCIVPGKAVLLDDWKSGTPSTNVETIIGTGGEKVTMASGKELWIYTYRAPYNGVKEKGPKKIHLVSELTGHSAVVASHNITSLTGVVHALEYNFTIFDFTKAPETFEDSEYTDYPEYTDAPEGSDSTYL